jgi:dynein regulatory complex subunit 2
MPLMSADERPLSNRRNSDEQQAARGLVRFKGRFLDEMIRPEELALYQELDAVHERHASKRELEKKLEEAHKGELERLDKSDEERKRGFAELKERQNRSDEERKKEYQELEERLNKSDEERKREFAELKNRLNKSDEDGRKEYLELKEHQNKSDEDRKRENLQQEKLSNNLQEIKGLEQEMRRLEQEMRRLEKEMRFTASEVMAEISIIRNTQWDEETKERLKKKKE